MNKSESFASHEQKKLVKIDKSQLDVVKNTGKDNALIMTLSCYSI